MRIMKIKKNYEEFDLNKIYFLACPDCGQCIPHIESFDYDSKENYFKLSYVCPCNNSIVKIKNAFLREFIIGYEPNNLCPIHNSNKLSFFCSVCNIQICQKCIDEKHHFQAHLIENNDKIISQEIAKSIFKKPKEKKINLKDLNYLKKYIIYIL